MLIAHTIGSEQTFRTLKRPFVYPDPYKIINDPDPDQGGPKNIRILRIRIRNTGYKKSVPEGIFGFFVSNQFSNSRYTGVFCTMANKPNNFNL